MAECTDIHLLQNAAQYLESTSLLWRASSSNIANWSSLDDFWEVLIKGIACTYKIPAQERFKLILNLFPVSKRRSTKAVIIDALVILSDEIDSQTIQNAISRFSSPHEPVLYIRNYANEALQVVAFDISPTAISECKRRFPNSQVSYQVADLLKPPETWFKGFNFILESYTLQVLPPGLRVVAISNISNFVALSGQLLVIARGREELDSPGKMPYPLTRRELEQFDRLGLKSQEFEDYFDTESPPVRRFRVLYTASTGT